MKTKHRSIGVVLLTIAIAIMISLPVNAITFRKTHSGKIISKVIDKVKEKIDVFKNQFRSHFRKTHLCKVKTTARKTPVFSPHHPYVVTANSGDNSTINITNVTAEPTSQVVGGYVNISCDVTTTEGNVSIVKVDITGPEGYGRKNLSMNRLNETDKYYYNSTYSTAGEYTYYIWANNTVGNSTKTANYTFTIFKKEENKTIHAITTDIGIEQHPSAISYGDIVFLAYEKIDGNKTNIYYRRSFDKGKTWPELDINYFDIGNAFYPRLSIVEDSYVAGTFESENNTYIYELDAVDVSDPSSWQLYYTDWSEYTFRNFSRPDISRFKPSQNMPWIIGVIGSTDYSGGECRRSPMFVYQDPNDPQSWVISWFNDIQNCSDISIAYNPVTNNITAVFEIQNETGQKVMFITGDITQEEAETVNYVFNDSYNLLSHPSILINNGIIYVAMEGTKDGNTDIICYISTDNGLNWTKSEISTKTNVNEKYPLLYSENDEIFCLYYESKNIYLVKSADGVHWTEPLMINDKDVVDDYQTADIVDSTHMVWTSRVSSTNYDLYCTILGEKPQPPGKVEVYVKDLHLEPFSDTQQINNVLAFTIGNTGNATANNVHITISYQKSGGGFISIYERDIDPLNAGDVQEREYVLFSCKFIDIIKSTFGLKSNGIMGKEGINALKNITAFKVEITANNDTSTSNNAAVLEVEFNDFGFPSISPDRADIHFNEAFNITVAKYGIPVKGAIVIYGPIREEIILPLVLFLSKINFKNINLKLRYKILLRILKLAIISLAPLAMVNYAITGEDGTTQLNIPSPVFSQRTQKTIHIIALGIKAISQYNFICSTKLTVT